MNILLLGPVEVTRGGDTVALGGPKERALLALLALHAGAAVAADELIDGLWGEEPPATAPKLLQLYVSHVRKALDSVGEREAIVTHGRGYELRVDREQVDVGRFERLLAQGAAREALALWRGRPLADIDGEPFAVGEVRRLEEMRTVALELAIDQDLQAGRHREVLAEIERLLAQEPLRERLHALRMLALYRSGRQAEALEAYRAARAVLIEEVGIEPGPELRRMQEAILRQDPSLHPPPEAELATREETLERLGDAAGRAAAGRAGWRVAEDDVAAGVVELQALREREAAEPTWSGSPFKGLASFDIDDAGVFFGRERLVAELVARVPGSRLMGIVGPSGGGKSSVLRAGLLAALADGVLPGSQGWPIVVVRPGRHPIQALDELPPEGRCVLAVDQFEETFTLCRDEGERARFIDALLRCARDPQRPILVILAIRADYYGRCAAYPELSRALGVNHALVGPMHREELRRAIELPARGAGLPLEPALADALMEDVAGEPGGLPLLSTALLELSEDELTLAAYERSGGVRGAVARLAEGAYERLDTDGRERARRILLRLSGDGDARARVPIAELDAGNVLQTLAAERLVTLGDGEAELAHEALLREWPRLRGWLEEDAEGRRLHRHLAQAAREWETAGRDPAELYRGTRLGAALDWSTNHGDELNAVEREFLAASNATAEQAAERERRTNRRLRALLGGAAVLLVAAVIAGGVALTQREEAEDAALAADAQRLGAVAVSEERLDQAVLLARAGVHLDATVATRANLLSVLMRHPAALGELRGDGWQLYSVAAAGPLLAIGDERGGVIVYDAATRRRLSTSVRYGVSEGLVQDLRFTPDATVLAALSHANNGITRLDLLDPRTGRRSRRVELPSFPEEVGFVFVLASFDADGSHLIVQQSDVDFANGSPSVLRRVNVRTGEIERSRRIGNTGAWSLSSTADRRRLLMTVAGDGRTYEVDPETLAVRRSWGDGDRAGAVAPDGSSFALADDKGRVRLLDLETGRSRRFEGTHEDGADVRMVFAPDGRTLVTSDAQGEVIVWDVQDGRIRERLTSHTESVNGLATSPDGRNLYTAGVDAKLTLWDLAGDRRLDRRFAAGPPMDFDDGSPKGLAVSPDGGTVALTQVDGRVDLLDTQTLRVRRSAQLVGGAALAAAYSADGKLLAVAGDGNEVLVRDARTLAPVRRLRTPPGGFIQGLAISPDGKRIAAGAFIPDASGAPGRLQIWDLQTGKPVVRPIEIAAVDLAFSPDSRLLAAAATEGDSAVFAAEDGRRRATLRTGDFGRSVAFSPNGRLLALGQYGGSTRLLSTTSFAPVGRSLEGHRARITALDFSPDGRRLLTGGADGTLRLWDAASRQPIASALELERDAYVAAAFAGGGSHVVAVPHFGRGVRWDVRPAAWERHACLVAARELTAREWRDALPERAQQPVC